jgi:hypothetical protein
VRPRVKIRRCPPAIKINKEAGENDPMTEANEKMRNMEQTMEAMFVATLATTSLGWAAEPPQVKMMTDTPEGIERPAP